MKEAQQPHESSATEERIDDLWERTTREFYDSDLCSECFVRTTTARLWEFTRRHIDDPEQLWKEMTTLSPGPPPWADTGELG